MEFPKEINGWKLKDGTKSTYVKGNGRIATITESKITIGTYIPAGATILKQEVSSVEEAIEILKKY